MPWSNIVLQALYDAVHAAAMKSLNNLLLLGDGETWSRQAIDCGGLPEMVRCFLQGRRWCRRHGIPCRSHRHGDPIR